MAAGVALTISNTRAVLEALFGVQTAFRPHSEVRDRRFAEGSSPGLEIPQPQWLASVCRTGHRDLLPGDDGLRCRDLSTSSRFRSWRSSSPATTGRDSPAFGRTSRDASAGAVSASSNSAVLPLRDSSSSLHSYDDRTAASARGQWCIARSCGWLRRRRRRALVYGFVSTPSFSRDTWSSCRVHALSLATPAFLPCILASGARRSPLLSLCSSPFRSLR